MSKEFQVMGSFGCMVSACGFFSAFKRTGSFVFQGQSVFILLLGKKDSKSYTQMIS